MKFDSVYYSEEVVDDGKPHSPQKTLLTFLGYRHEERSRRVSHKSGGQTTLTYKGDGEYVVGKNPTYYHYTDYYKTAYISPQDYTKRQEALMDALYDQLSENGGFNPVERAYLPVSVKGYYREVVRFPGEFEAKQGFWIGVVLGVLWLFVSFFGTVYVPLIADLMQVIASFFGLDDAVFFGIAIVIWLVCSLLGVIAQGIGRLFYGKRTPYKRLTKEQKEEYREKYLTYITKRYGGRAGEILRQFAIERGYDQI